MLKIVVIGPESTGKTTLCQLLAEHFKGQCVEEYAREYVEQLHRDYTYEDVEIIARKQYEQLTAVYPDGDIMFFDTDLVITKIWFQVVYRKIPTWISEAIISEKVDFYIICRPDLPWVYDPVRENQKSRLSLYEAYKNEVLALGIPFFELDGKGDSRFRKAVFAMEQFILESKNKIA